MTFEECPFDMLCSQGFCRLPCSIELLCPVGTFCNKESVCEAHGKLANRKERNGVFSEIIFNTLSELNEMPSFGGKLQNLKSNVRSGDYLNYQIETQNEVRKPIEMDSLDNPGKTSITCGSNCRNFLSLISQIQRQKNTNKPVVKSRKEKDLQNGEVIRITKRRDFTTGRIRSTGEKEREKAKTPETKLQSVLDVKSEQTLNKMGSTQISKTDGQPGAVNIETESQEARISRTNQNFMKTFIETLMAAMERESSEIKNNRTSLSKILERDASRDNKGLENACTKSGDFKAASIYVKSEITLCTACSINDVLGL